MLSRDMKCCYCRVVDGLVRAINNMGERQDIREGININLPVRMLLTIKIRIDKVYQTSQPSKVSYVLLLHSKLLGSRCNLLCNFD